MKELRDFFWVMVAVAVLSFLVLALQAKKAGAAERECLKSDAQVWAVHGEKTHSTWSRRVQGFEGRKCYFAGFPPSKQRHAATPPPVLARASMVPEVQDDGMAVATIQAVELWAIDRDMARHQISPGFEPSMVIITIRMAHVTPYWPEMAAFTVEDRRVWWPLEVKRHILSMR